MSTGNNNNNPAPKNPVHHAKQAKAGATDHVAGEDDVGPEDYQGPLIKDEMNGHLPANVLIDGGEAQGTPAEPTPAPKVETGEQFAREKADAVYDAATKDTSKFDDALEGVIDLGFLINGVDRRTVKQRMAYNGEQVRRGGFALLRVCDKPRAAVLNIPGPRLGKALGKGERIRKMLLKLDTARDVLISDYSVSLNEVNDIIQGVLDTRVSLILSDAEWTRLLGPALEIRGGPAALAQQAKADKARLEAAIRGEDQGKQPPPGGTGPTGTTTTVTTQTAPPEAPPAPAPPLKATVGHRKAKPSGQ